MVFLIYSLFQEIRKEAENFLWQKTRLLELKTKIKKLKEFQAVSEIYQPNLEKINQLFINSAEPINFIKFLEKEAARSQLLIEISPLLSKQKKDDPWPSLNFQLTLSGFFPDFLKFFKKLESSSYLIEILNLRVRKLSSKEEEKEKINATLLIKVYAR